MAESDVVERPPFSAWQVQSLRMTAFPGSAAQIVAEPTWWTDLVGESSETRVLQVKQRVRREEGPFEGGKLVLTTQPTRIDWLYIAVDDLEGRQDGPATIGPFPDSISTFSRLMLRWFELGACPPVQRLALGAILLQPADDQQAGYRQLAAYLPNFHLNPQGVSDFFYQINRPRNSTSGVAGLRINRLSRWSVLIWTLAQFPLTEGAVRSSMRRQGALCQLELDINTAPDFPKDLPQEQLPSIFEELVNLGQEIAREGDIP